MARMGVPQVDRVKFLLGEKDIPATWYNIVADLPGPPPAPALSAMTRQPLSREEMLRVMPEQLADQELSREREIEIPQVVRQLYAQWRPSPLIRARRLERQL